MANLNMPNLNIKPDKYLFKKKLTLKRKSVKRLIRESFLMLIMSSFLVFIIYLIPNKNLLLQNFPITINKSFILLVDLFIYIFQLFQVGYIFFSGLIALILLLGSIYRVFKVIRRKTKRLTYK